MLDTPAKNQKPDAHFVEKNYCVRSIAFVERELVVHSAKSNGVVVAAVKRHIAKGE
jgi:hypothetical protein